MGLRITTWNVNGIRNPFGYQPWREKRTFHAMFDILEADIVVMQETKIQRKDLRDDMVLVPGWDVYFSLPRHKKGYSGVVIYTRNSKCCPIRAEEGILGVLCPPNSTTAFRDLPVDQQIGGYPKPGQLDSSIDEATLDSEGRCVILEFPAFVLIGVYSPATRDDTRTEFRMGFHAAMDVRIRNLVAMGKEVILTGDLNIIRDELDTAKLRDQLRKDDMSFEEFMSMPSRRFFNQLLYGGRVFGEGRDEGREEPVMWDICREFHPSREGMFTCWETKKNARPGNFGSRIDYVCVTDGIKKWFVDSNIQEGLHGSDHCPVYGTIGDTVQSGDQDLHIEDIMNPEGMFKGGKRLREWTVKDLLPLSAKLIPEFDRRQSIKDMFFKKSAPPTKAELSSKSTAADAALAPTAITPLESPFTESSTPSKGTEEAAEDFSIPPPPASITKPSPKPTAQKRTAEVSQSSARPQKKTKATLVKESSSRSASGPSQSTLMGFFKPKVTATAQASNDAAIVPAEDTASEARAPFISPVKARTHPFRSNMDNAAEDANDDSIKTSPSRRTGTAAKEAADTVFDPIENKESWSKLLGKRVVPKCEHEEPCISLVTKKPGVNCGRSFYICPRPLGPTGEKEKGTQWRCGTFIWSSDWNKSQQS